MWVFLFRKKGSYLFFRKYSTDFSTTNLRPDLEKNWDYEKNTISPSEISLGSHKKVYWKCAICGHTWITMMFNRTTHKAGCPKCAIRYRNEKE